MYDEFIKGEIIVNVFMGKQWEKLNQPSKATQAGTSQLGQLVFFLRTISTVGNHVYTLLLLYRPNPQLVLISLLIFAKITPDHTLFLRKDLHYYRLHHLHMDGGIGQRCVAFLVGLKQ